MSARLNRRGAILPLTILMLAIMGVAVAITYARLSSERRTTSDAQAQMNAFGVAQSGLSRFMSNLPVGVKPGWLDPMDVTYNDLPGGTAQVSLRMIRDTTIAVNQLPAVYAIVSRGTNTSARRFGASTPPAERTVATYALWTPAPFKLNGAITTLGPIDYNGNSATLSGIDRCGVQGSTAGIATPDADLSLFNQQPPDYIDGSPDDAAADLGNPYPATGPGSATDNVDIDWTAVEAGTAFPADNPVGTWPADFSNWPVTRVDGDLILPGSGKGILIVTGNMTWNGTPLKTWEGIILIGGSLTHNGNGNVYGAVVTNLDVKNGTAPTITNIGNGTKTYQYDSCAISRALGHIGSIQPVRNGWIDTWPSYQ